MPYNCLFGAQSVINSSEKKILVIQTRDRPKVVVQGSQIKVTEELALLGIVRVN
jgi:hypothetical protein